MATNSLPSQNSRTILCAPTRKPLSCTNCRQRKVKCNREDPCNPCLKSGLKCVFPTRRIRASRVRPEIVKERDAELLERIRRLEAMLAGKVERDAPTESESGSSSSSQTSTSIIPLPSDGLSSQIAQSGITIDEHYASFVKQQSCSCRHLSSEFWSSISSEFETLRVLIQDGFDEEDESDDGVNQSAEEIDSAPSFILQDPQIFTAVETAYPSKTQSSILIKFYFSNVDPVCKILHRPTVDTYFSNLEPLIDSSTGRFKFRSFEAVTFAAYFAAVTSMSPQECLTHLGEQRDVLVERYKRSTEVALFQADFLSTLEIPTLQALTIYIVMQLSLNRARNSWTLIGLAVRIARGMSLDRDGDGRAISAFEAEMRRRLWWQILALDMRASEHRGSETVIESPLGTVMPCNLNDADYTYGSQHPLRGRIGPTEMTICLLDMDALWTSRKINNRYSDHELRLTTEEKEVLIKEYATRVESTYLANCDFTDPKIELLRIIGQYWVYKLLLNLYYPLQQRMPSPQVRPDVRGLQIALLFLDANELIEQHPYSAGFAWLFKTYLPWHAVAVVLAELITKPESALAARAWEIINRRFRDWTRRVADVKETMLWGLIKNLLKRARAAQQQSQQGGRHPQRFDLLGISSPFADASFDLSGLFDPITRLPLNLVTFDPHSMAAGESNIPNMSKNLDSWNDFAFDVNALGGHFSLYDV